MAILLPPRSSSLYTAEIPKPRSERCRTRGCEFLLLPREMFSEMFDERRELFVMRR